MHPIWVVTSPYHEQMIDDLNLTVKQVKIVEEVINEAYSRGFHEGYDQCNDGA